jgi:copper chaperone CopZ
MWPAGRHEMTSKTIVLEVIGENRICCATCENTISRALAQLPGVRQVAPSHKTQRVALTLNIRETPIETVRKRLGQIGWQTREPMGNPNQGARHP